MKKRVEEFFAKIQQKPKRPYTQPPVRAFSALQAACKKPKQTPNEGVLCLLLASSFLYVPAGSESIYHASTYWYKFKTINNPPSPKTNKRRRWRRLVCVGIKIVRFFCSFCDNCASNG